MSCFSIKRLDLIEYFGKRVGFDKKRGISGSLRGISSKSVGLTPDAWDLVGMIIVSEIDLLCLVCIYIFRAYRYIHFKGMNRFKNINKTMKNLNKLI